MDELQKVFAEYKRIRVVFIEVQETSLPNSAIGSGILFR
jgi:hypothetical protein